MLLKPWANCIACIVIVNKGIVLSFLTHESSKCISTGISTRTTIHPCRRIYTFRYMQTSAYMRWNKWGACFYCSTFCSFASPSSSPEGHDSSVSGEISCMIEQHSKEMVLSSVWQSPAEQLKEAEAWRHGLCVCVCACVDVCVSVCVGRWHWKRHSSKQIQLDTQLEYQNTSTLRTTIPVSLALHKIDLFT